MQLESTVPNWLDKDIKRKQVVVEDTPPNWDDLLAKLGKDKGKKKARVILRIEIDEENNMVVHIATPIPDKNQDKVTRGDYNL